MGLQGEVIELAVAKALGEYAITPLRTFQDTHI
jgi:hypothetical protein